MGVNFGYKLTEVGVIPHDWSVVRIDEYASTKTGSKNTQDRVDDGEYPFFVRSQQVERINSYSYDSEAVLTAGDGVGTGKVFHYIKGRFDVHQRVYRIADFSNQLNGLYFFYQFSTRFYVRIMSMTAKSSVDSVRMEMIAGMKIPLPSPPEQRAIAETLSDVDKLIESLEKLTSKKRAIKKATMQQLLTGKTRLPGFSGEWEVIRLGDLAQFLKGCGLSKTDLIQNGEYRCIHYGELFTSYGERIDKIISRTNTITEYKYSHQNDVLMPTSDVTPNGLATASCIRESGVILGGDILIIRTPEARINGEFLAYCVGANRDQIMQLVSGTTVFHLYGSDMANFVFRAPAVHEQGEIVKILSDMDAEITALERRRDKTKQIKQGMMQELLTGRIRLVKPEEKK